MMINYMTADDMRKLLRAACDEAGGQSRWAEINSVSPTVVSGVFRGMPPTASICKSLKVQHVVRYLTDDDAALAAVSKPSATADLGDNPVRDAMTAAAAHFANTPMAEVFQGMLTFSDICDELHTAIYG